VSANLERRARLERRVIDAGPPDGSSERRRHAERRLPKSEEMQISADDWERYFGTSARASNTTDYLLDQGIAVFNRIRDDY